MPVISEVAKQMVRNYAENNMDALVVILRGGRGQLNPKTGVVSGMAGARSIYDSDAGNGSGGKARIHTVSGQGSISLGPGQVDTRSATISVPWSATIPQRDDVVLVISGGSDTTLNGNAFRVVEVSGGGAFGDARRMSCVAWGKSEYWTGLGLGGVVRNTYITGDVTARTTVSGGATI